MKIGYGINLLEITAGWAGNGWLLFRKSLRKIWLESKWITPFCVIPAELREQRNIRKGFSIWNVAHGNSSPIVWYFQAFAAVFRYMELNCTDGKRNSGTKFTSPEFYLPFTQNVNRPVWQVNGKQQIIFSTHYPTLQRDSSRHCLIDCFTHYNSVFTNQTQNTVRIFFLDNYLRKF